MSDEVDEQPELTAISSLVFWDHEQKWNEIADYVRNGCSDPQFLFVLQKTIDPEVPFRELSLIVKRKQGRPRKSDQSQDVHVLVRLLRNKKRARHGLLLIASEIEQNGLNDEWLRKDLADMFSQTTEGPLGMKFDVARFGSRKPRSGKKLQAQNFLELHADIFGEKTTEVVAAAARIYGIDDETARKYLQWRRGLRKKDAFWSNAFERDIALSMREKGDQEYQPLKDILKNTE